MIIYTCDTADGMHEGRERLFLRWYRSSTTDGIIMNTSRLKHPLGGPDILACAIYRSDFPFKDEVLQILEKDAQALVRDKYDAE